MIFMGITTIEKREMRSCLMALREARPLCWETAALREERLEDFTK